MGKKSQLDDVKCSVCRQKKKTNKNVLGFFRLRGEKKGRSKATDTEDTSFLLSGVKEG